VDGNAKNRTASIFPEENIGAMTVRTRSAAMWARWKRLAHRAAEIQAYVLLTVLYVIVVVPVGLMRRKASRAVLRETTRPAWQTRTPPASAAASAESLQDARQQF
jgi:hypothetical protein